MPESKLLIRKRFQNVSCFQQIFYSQIAVLDFFCFFFGTNYCYFMLRVFEVGGGGGLRLWFEMEKMMYV